jgi:hypothetical protein
MVMPEFKPLIGFTTDYQQVFWLFIPRYIFYKLSAGAQLALRTRAIRALPAFFRAFKFRPCKITGIFYDFGMLDEF